ncbi:hypothetical protein C8R44DRAFT_793057 [Mycena epipterygia]|nr:hypothetical protein C8R44DRAFT_793057 [Mycena epipterygia]
MKLAEVDEILTEACKALELLYEVIDSRRRRGKECAPRHQPSPVVDRYRRLK